MIELPLKFCNWDEYWAWSQGSLWLSLDRFERFWPDAGLAFSNGEAVKSAIREALRAKYAMDAADRARWAADPDAEDDMDYSDHAHAEACLRSIAETAGTEDAERVVAWITGPVLAQRNDPAWRRRWRAILYHLWEDDPDTVASRHGISSDTARRIGEISARFKSESDAYDERIDEAKQEPLSGWDAIAYQEYRREDSEWDPLTGVGLYLWYITFDRAWAEVRRRTRPDEIDGLIRWGRARVRELVEPEYEEQVILPEDVRRAW
jgi:hypothetical protein